MTAQCSRFDLIRRSILSAIVVSVAQWLCLPASAQTSAAAPLSPSRLEQLVAPIALYPDNLMSQVLMASTYPLEVVEASRWSRDNKNVSGKTLEDAMAKESWDPSVKALAAVPQTLQMMNDKLDWTQQLGDAFLAQQQDVLDAVQRLRQRADNAGNLKTTPQQVVSRSISTTASASSEPTAISIAPVDPDMLYVPVYDPGVIFGAWPDPAYQPFFWYPPGFAATNVLSFAAGVAVGAAIWANVDWRRRDVNINVNRYNEFNRTRIASNDWTHNPVHRGSVPYRDPNVAQKFGNAQKAAAREDFRNRADAGRRDLTNPAAKNTARNAVKNNAARRPDGARTNLAQNPRAKQVSQQARGKQIAQKRTGTAKRVQARPENLNRTRVASHAEMGRAHAQNFNLAGGRPGGGGAMRARGGGGGMHARGGGRRR